MTYSIKLKIAYIFVSNIPNPFSRKLSRKIQKADTENTFMTCSLYLLFQYKIPLLHRYFIYLYQNIILFL